MVGDLRMSPAHHQSTAVHMLNLHVDGSAAAYWEEDGGRNRRQKGGMWRKCAEKGKRGDKGRREDVSRRELKMGRIMAYENVFFPIQRGKYAILKL